MGEILRAVLDATAIYSAPAFYSQQIPSVSTGPLARALGRRATVLQCKSDTWFLMTGWSQDTQLGTANPTWESKTFPSTFSVTDMKTSRSYSLGQILHSNGGYTLNNQIYLPSYILWPPASLIGITMDVVTQNPVATINAQTFVTLCGIEYQMPPGKG